MTEAPRGGTRWGIRTRILLIAVIPSMTLLTIGLAGATLVVRNGQQAQTFARTLGDSIAHNQAMAAAVEQERLLTIWQLTGTAQDRSGLTTARRALDDALEALLPDIAAMQHTGGDELRRHLDDFDNLRSQLQLVRSRVNTNFISMPEVYRFFSAMLSGFDRSGLALIERNAPDRSAAVELTVNLQTLRAVEEMSRSSALTAAVVNDAALPPDLTNELRNLVGSYHAHFEQLATQSSIEGVAAKAVVNSPAWQRTSLMENAVIDSTAPTTALPLSPLEWRDSATEVNQRLLDLWGAHGTAALARAEQTARQDARNSIFAGAAVFGLAVAAFLVALWLANRLIGRLRRLRVETLALAEVGLPDTMRRLAAGAEVDAESEAAHLDYGHDELGSVASAFNRAHTAAVAAAISAARTQRGVRAVFLNIAHRSQLVVHRQLEILDAAESRQEDPVLLDIFFQLDHLATRERRNAENLMVLGGGQPARQWRRPVPLIDVVRSAIGETLDYARVRTGQLPDVLLSGEVVSDLIHLLAELVDNATSFSPPQARVDVTGNLAGRGAIVQISDQGIGMSTDELTRANDMLRDPPDFGVATLSEDSRLGLFVVAQLGARHAISTRLSDSDYGGVRAIVLVPTALVVPGQADRARPEPHDELRTER
ncbi:sensor histidine kinase [Nocardia salmonicida]